MAAEHIENALLRASCKRFRRAQDGAPLLGQSPGVHFDYIDQRFSAREIGQISDAVIEHDSAHDEERLASRGRFKTLLRELERRLLRSGRTRQSRLKGELSVLVKASA